MTDYSLKGQLKAKARREREEHVINPAEDPFRELRFDEEIYLSILMTQLDVMGPPLTEAELKVKGKIDDGPILQLLRRLQQGGFLSYTRVPRGHQNLRLTAWAITPLGLEKLSKVKTKIAPEYRKLLKLSPQPQKGHRNEDPG